MLPVGEIIVYVLGKIGTVFTSVVLPLAQIMLYFMFIVLIVTFIANISGIIGCCLFMLMFYYYVKGIIFIDPAPKNNV
jgi:hypothetical protein